MRIVEGLRMPDRCRAVELGEFEQEHWNPWEICEYFGCTDCDLSPDHPFWDGITVEEWHERRRKLDEERPEPLQDGGEIPF